MRMRFSLNDIDNNIIDIISKDVIDRYIASRCDEMIFIGIGTDKCIGDAVGCLTGTFLESNCDNIKVYGTVQNPIHALNIERSINIIMNSHRNSFIIGVDASLGDLEDVHKFIYSDTSIKPGAGVGKRLPTIGDISLKFVVGEAGDYVFTSRNFRLADIWSGADLISKVLLNVDKKISEIKTKNIKIVDRVIV